MDNLHNHHENPDEDHTKPLADKRILSSLEYYAGDILETVKVADTKVMEHSLGAVPTHILDGENIAGYVPDDKAKLAAEEEKSRAKEEGKGKGKQERPSTKKTRTLELKKKQLQEKRMRRQKKIAERTDASTSNSAALSQPSTPARSGPSTPPPNQLQDMEIDNDATPKKHSSEFQ